MRHARHHDALEIRKHVFDRFGLFRRNLWQLGHDGAGRARRAHAPVANSGQIVGTPIGRAPRPVSKIEWSVHRGIQIVKSNGRALVEPSARERARDGTMTAEGLEL